MAISSSIERLEPRIAPAGITAFVKGGTLFITGSQASTLIVEHAVDPINWYVTDDGTPSGPFTGVRAVDIRLTGPASTVVMLMESSFAGKTNVSLGFGDDAFTVSKGAAAEIAMGPLTVSGGLGVDTFRLAADFTDTGLIFQNVTIRGGGGADGAILGLNATNTLGSVKLYDLEGSGGGGQINGNLTINNRFAAGDSAARYLTILGSFNYVGSNFADLVQVIGTVGGSRAAIDVKNGINTVMLSGNTTGSFPQAIIQGGSDKDTVFAVGGDFQAPLTLKLGEGDNLVFLQGSTYAKTVTVLSGSGADALDVANSTFQGALTVKAGNGANDLKVANTQALRGMNLFAGTGADTVLFSAATTITGRLLVNLGTLGFNEFRLNANAGSSLTITGGFTYLGGSGNDSVAGLGAGFAVGGALIAKLGDGDNYFELAGDVDGRSILVKTGRGTDTVYVDLVADLTTLAVLTGSGDDTIQIFGSYRGGVLNAGAGLDTLSGNPPTNLRRIGFDVMM